MKFNWVNDDYKIDFPVPTILKNTIEEAEEADMNNEYGEYYGLAYALDTLGKNCYGAGEITKKQWDIICARFPVN